MDCMNDAQFKYFDDFRNRFREKVKEWSEFSDQLQKLQEQAAAGKDGKADYRIETPVVYNTALDAVTKDDEIRLIIIGDNPGKNEQLEKNRKYLVGLAGKLGQKFFAENPELGIDFRKNAIILNKTPVHSARTEQLKYIIKNGSPQLNAMITESQEWMARETALLHMNLARLGGKGSYVPQLWLVGYAELKGKGLFLTYRDTLVNTYETDFCTDNVYTFQHFSMNRFTIDLKNYMEKKGSLSPENTEKASLAKDLAELGSLHRKEILGV